MAYFFRKHKFLKKFKAPSPVRFPASPTVRGKTCFSYKTCTVTSPCSLSKQTYIRIAYIILLSHHAHCRTLYRATRRSFGNTELSSIHSLYTLVWSKTITSLLRFVASAREVTITNTKLALRFTTWLRRGELNHNANSKFNQPSHLDIASLGGYLD